MAAPPAHKPAVPVVRIRSAVHAYSDPDAKFIEEAQVRIVQANGVCLHARVYRHTWPGGIPDRGHQVGDEVPSGQQRLAAMQNERDTAEPVRPGVLADTHGGAFRDLTRHASRLITP
jgi:hypothetical protein